MLHLGTSQSDITPPLPMMMGESFSKFESREVLDPIMANCIVADDGEERIAYVSCDLGSVSRDMLWHGRTDTRYQLRTYRQTDLMKFFPIKKTMEVHR